MKSLKLLLTFTLIFLGSSVFAQNITLQVSGHVTDQQTSLPIANHLVAVTVNADSILPFFPYTDSTVTDQSGWYTFTFPVNFTPGAASFFSVGTYDCMMNWLQQVMVYSGNQTSFTADFSICNDTIFPPSGCENYIMPVAIQGLTVTLEGGLLNGQQASCYWNFGDGYNSMGQIVTHTYQQQGIYNVVLQTVTPDSCVDFSNYTVVLMDSIDPPSPCANYININGIQGLTVTLQGNLINGQPASFFWDLGDNSTTSGQYVTHSYNQQGIYNIVLQTITADGCLFTSTFPLILMDSIPNGCAGYFMATPTGSPLEMAFQGFTQSQYPTVFTWELGDGTSATGQNLTHTYCCSGTYTVMLTTTDSTGCSSSFVAPVAVFPDSTGNMVVSGQVIAGNIPLSQGMVTLFGVDPAGYYYPVQTTYIDSVGLYNFWNVGTGTYIIIAFPQPDSLPGAQQYLPTYYGDVIFWEQATPIYLGVPLNPNTINLVNFDSIGGGDGSILGQLIGGGKAMLTAGQEILLLDASGTPVRISYTDGQGNFSFTNLPYGEYQVNPVITGLTTQPVPVVLDATNPSSTVIMIIYGNTITGMSEKTQTNLITSLYPNPAMDWIAFTMNKPGNVELQILDAYGKTVMVMSETILIKGSILTIPVSDFIPGIYFLRILDEKGNASSRRFVKN